MPIIDGQPVRASTPNTAFLDAQEDDIAIGVIGLANANSVSGPAVMNTQRELNSLASFLGKALNAVKNALPTWASNDAGASTDNVFTRADALSAKFSPTTGHAHSGGAGDGAPISAGDLTDLSLTGRFVAATTLTGVTGSSLDVSTQLLTLSPSTSDTVEGVVVVPAHNVVPIRQAAGADAGFEFLDGGGNTVYGRLTYASGVYTLSFFSRIAGTETAYTFATDQDVAWYYQGLFNPISDAPIYADGVAGLKGSRGGSGGGGGGSLQWVEDADAPLYAQEFASPVYLFQQGLVQKIWATVKVPKTYAPGTQIKAKVLFYSPDNAGTLGPVITSYLIRTGVDAADSVANSETTSGAIALSVGTVNIPQAADIALTDSTGQINGVAVNPDDQIRIQLSRTDTGTPPSDMRCLVYSTEVSFS